MSQLDYKKLAGLAGMTNPASVSSAAHAPFVLVHDSNFARAPQASNAWIKIKKKLNAQAEAVMGDGAATPTSTAKATPGKKRGRKALGDAEGGETPSKACRADQTGSLREEKANERRRNPKLPKPRRPRAKTMPTMRRP